jgi:hypothetical protein
MLQALIYGDHASSEVVDGGGMKAKREGIDAFDRAYCDRIRDAVWEAIISASRDPATKVAQLRTRQTPRTQTVSMWIVRAV